MIVGHVAKNPTEKKFISDENNNFAHNFILQQNNH